MHNLYGRLGNGSLAYQVFIVPDFRGILALLCLTHIKNPQDRKPVAIERSARSNYGRFGAESGIPSKETNFQTQASPRNAVHNQEEDPKMTLRRRHTAEEWAAVRADYVIGLYPTLQELAKKHGLTYRSVYNKMTAEPELWERAPPQAIAELRTELVQSEELRKAITADMRAAVKDELASTTKADIAAIHSLARQQADIILKERADITGVLATVSTMMQELDESAPPPGARQDRDSLSVLASRAKVAKDLVDVLKTLVGLQRQAFGIADNANGEANKPEEREMSANEMAREIAFAMNSLEYRAPVIEGEVLPT